MDQCNSCRLSCTVWAIVASIVFGIAFAIFSYLGLVTAVPTALFTLITGLLLIPIGLFSVILTDGRCCVCQGIGRLFLSAAGSVIGSCLILFLTSVLGTTITAIVTGLTVLSLILGLATLMCMALCICDRGNCL